MFADPKEVTNSARASVEPESGSTEYLFISHTLAVGGIETLLARMANALVRDGLPVTVLAPAGPIAEFLDPGVRHTEWDGDPDSIGTFAPRGTTTHVNIWCSLPTLMVDAWPLQKRLWETRRVRSSCTAGIFHPDQWYHGGRHSGAFAKGRLIQALAEPGSIYFMNDASRAAHVTRWGDHLGRCPVYRLHLEEGTDVRWRPTRSDRLKIVSIGRIVPFKNYNYDAAQMLGKLAQRGIDASWDIFGDGPDRPRLIAECEAAGLRDRLRFPGEVAYDQLRPLLLSYDLFVGMGTAALEAAAIAMPTLLALSDQPRGSYGFLNEAPSDSVAELVDGVPPIDMADKIAEFASLDDRQRVRLGEQCRQSAVQRSGDERSPFAGMFAAGRQFPSGAWRRLRADLLFAARRASRRLGSVAAA